MILSTIRRNQRRQLRWYQKVSPITSYYMVTGVKGGMEENDPENPSYSRLDHPLDRPDIPGLLFERPPFPESGCRDFAHTPPGSWRGIPACVQMHHESSP